MKITEKSITYDLHLEYFDDDDFFCLSLFNDEYEELGYLTFKAKSKPYRHIYINKIKNKSSQQRKGIGSALIQALEFIAYVKNIPQIEGKFYPENEYAKPFYEKHGYKIQKEYYEVEILKQLDFEKIKAEIEPKISNFSFPDKNDINYYL